MSEEEFNASTTSTQAPQSAREQSPGVQSPAEQSPAEHSLSSSASRGIITVGDVLLDAALPPREDTSVMFRAQKLPPNLVIGEEADAALVPTVMWCVMPLVLTLLFAGGTAAYLLATGEHAPGPWVLCGVFLLISACVCAPLSNTRTTFDKVRCEVTSRTAHCLLSCFWSERACAFDEVERVVVDHVVQFRCNECCVVSLLLADGRRFNVAAAPSAEVDELWMAWHSYVSMLRGVSPRMAAASRGAPIDEEDADYFADSRPLGGPPTPNGDVDVAADAPYYGRLHRRYLQPGEVWESETEEGSSDDDGAVPHIITV
jgi:hypothetical protein